MSKIKNDISAEELFCVEEVAPDGNLQLPNPGLVSYYKDIHPKTRMLYVTRDIDDSLMEELRHIIRWNMEDEAAGIPVEERTPIKVLINSYGGALDMCLAAMDLIKLSKTKVITINLQVAASAAALILMAGHERYALKNSWALVHQGSGGAQGTYSIAEAQMANYKKLVEKMKDAVLEFTKIDSKTYSRKKDQEWYMYDDDMIKYGLVDKIVDDISVLYAKK